MMDSDGVKERSQVASLTRVTRRQHSTVYEQDVRSVVKGNSSET